MAVYADFVSSLATKVHKVKVYVANVTNNIRSAPDDCFTSSFHFSAFFRLKWIFLRSAASTPLSLRMRMRRTELSLGKDWEPKRSSALGRASLHRMGQANTQV